MSGSIWEWPIPDFIQALIDCGIIDRSNPRPCSICKDRLIYGPPHKKYCAKCRQELFNDNARKYKCLDCGKPVYAKRCHDCAARERARRAA